MRVVLTGGGTGGHVYPALAIAGGILHRYPDSEILYIGASHGFESDIVPKAGYSFFPIPVKGLRRKVSLHNVLAVWQAGRSYVLARAKIAEFKPQVVIGTGGYVCGPVVLAAVNQGIPTLIHEQNALPGLTNRLLSRYVTKTALTFMDAYKYFPSRARVILTGLPVRTEILQANREEARRRLGLGDLFTVVSFGGSQGARTLNNAFLEVLPLLVPDGRFCFFHATGTAGYEDFLAGLKSRGFNPQEARQVTVAPYFYNIPELLAAADLIVCRAGASTLAEITVLGLPSILIPYPFATGNHQEYNARVLADRGAALLIKDSEVTGLKIAELVKSLESNPAKLQSMRMASRQLGKRRALENLLDAVDSIASCDR
ncbi:MAG: undecaprenyldiphospho-muramoylpentapeptide beta-N-acetylglucosaminyltransferase [Bacillota bacterium]